MLRRDVSSLPNPFDQDLNTFDPVEFDQVNINDNLLISTLNDSFTRIHQTPASNFNDKVFEFQSKTDTGAVMLRVNNVGQKSAGIRLLTQSIYDGNAFIQYETGTNRWFSGVNKTSNEYRIHYSPGDPTDNLYNAANERLSIDSSGNTTIRGDLFLDNGNTQISSNDDSTTTFTQTPASLVSGKVFKLVSDSNAQVQLSVTNNGGTINSHSMINLQSDATAAIGNGGNQMIYYDTAGTGGWSVGTKIN